MQIARKRYELAKNTIEQRKCGDSMRLTILCYITLKVWVLLFDTSGATFFMRLSENDRKNARFQKNYNIDYIE